MKKSDVKIGGTYYANVSGKRVEVRIDQESPHGGWDATNLATGENVRIKTAQRLHGAARGGQAAKQAGTQPSASEKTKAGVAEVKKPSKTKAAKPDGDKKLSAIDAAAKVVSESAEPMSSKQLIEVLAEKGLWKSPGGKTPDRTLYSAILREVNAKADKSRFRKVERGRFVANA